MEKDTLIAQMFSRISPWYDFLNHFLSLGIDIYWRKKLIDCVRGNPSCILDMATGTMDVAIGLKKKFPWCRVIGSDLSYEMLLRGRKKTSAIVPLCSNGKHLPFKPASIDIITIAFGVRNINPRSLLYREVHRVLKDKGMFLILEFASARNKILLGIYNLYLEKLLPLLGRLISQDKEAYSYLSRTIKEFPLAEDLQIEIKEAGFSRVEFFPLTGGIVNIHIAQK